MIINADDFGWSAGITEGIIRAHREGIVTSATLAANMPDAAGAIGRMKEVPDLGVGLHLNATQGPPLSEAGRALLAGPDGLMNRTAIGLIVACIRRPRLIDAVAAEFEAQIRWALDRGLRPTHLDSHRHSHAFGPIFVRVIGLARRYDIRFIRRHRECLAGRGWPASTAKQRRNRLILNCLGAVNSAAGGRFMPARACLGVAHTGLISRAWLIRAAQTIRTGLTEIMTHPGLPDGLDESATRLRQSRLDELAALCSPAVRQEFGRNGIELTNYGRL